MAKRASVGNTRGSSRARHWAQEGEAKMEREEGERKRRGLLDGVLGKENGWESEGQNARGTERE